MQKLDVQVTNFKIANEIYGIYIIFIFLYIIYALSMHDNFFTCFYEENIHISKFLTTTYM